MEREKRNKFIKMLIRCMFLTFIIGSVGYLYTLKKSIAAENESLQQELEKHEQEWKRKRAEDAEAEQEEEKAEKEENTDRRYCAAFPHLDIPVYVMKRNFLYSYILYGVESYCEEQGIQDKFTCNLDEEMHWGTYYNEYGETWDRDAYSIDLSKEIIPELQNNIYNFYLTGETHNLYVQVNTYLMKIFVYDAAETVVFPGEDNEDIRKQME